MPTPSESPHPDSPSLSLDLKRLLGRRRTLGWLAGATASGLLAACGKPAAQARAVAQAAPTLPSCTPAGDMTNGPFPADGSNGARDGDGILNVLTRSGIVRSDITTSFGGASGKAAGVPLKLVIQVTAHCAPAAGYAVYVWHCTADGLYSLYDEPEQNYLRGVQVSDTQGQVAFTTVFPGCYAGRLTHIHVEVYGSPAEAVDAGKALKVTQLTFPMATLHDVYAQARGYGSSAANLADTGYASDMVFGETTPAELTAATARMSGDMRGGLTAIATVAV